MLPKAPKGLKGKSETVNPGQELLSGSFFRLGNHVCGEQGMRGQSGLWMELLLASFCLVSAFEVDTPLLLLPHRTDLIVSRCYIYT